MKSATVACSLILGLLALVAAPTLASRPQAQTNEPAGLQRPGTDQTPQPAAGQAPTSQTAPAPAPRASGTGRAGERRRRSYASCNRLSQARGLHGGVRRRFLIRCRLGYERPKAAQPQTPPARQP